MMFWNQVRVAVVVAFGVAATTLAMAGDVKKPEQAAQVPAEPAKEEVLEFRRLEVKSPNTLKSEKQAFLVCRNNRNGAMQLPWAYADATPTNDPPAVSVGARPYIRWLSSLKPNNGEMILAVFKGANSGSSKLTIRKVAVVGGELRVNMEFVQGRTKDIGYPYDLVVCRFFDLPVAFYENDKEVARIPFEAAGDVELSNFLDEPIRFANLCALATVEAPPQAPPPPPPERPGVAYSSLAPEISVKLRPEETKVLYGDPSDKLTTILYADTMHGGEARFRAGDRIVFVAGRSIPIKWSPEREKAVKFALVPGWSRSAWVGPVLICPWCKGPNRAASPVTKCPVCGKDKERDQFKLCEACASVRGECQMCSRRVGPATRRVELLLGTKDPLRTTSDIDPMTFAIPPGQVPDLWVAAKLNNAREMPELVCPGKRVDLAHGLLFLVEKPGTTEPEVVFPSVPEVKAKDPYTPISSSSSGSVTLGYSFAKPGNHIIRAVAGRLMSKPVTVIVTTVQP